MVRLREPQFKIGSINILLRCTNQDLILYQSLEISNHSVAQSLVAIDLIKAGFSTNLFQAITAAILD
jgi:hypothetical protein